MTDMIQRHFQTQETRLQIFTTAQCPGTRYQAYVVFRSRHSAVHIPMGTGDRPDPLHTRWQALRISRRRDRVHKDLQSLLHTTPILGQFTEIFHVKIGHSSGGPSGLQYKHVQNWS